MTVPDRIRKSEPSEASALGTTKSRADSYQLTGNGVTLGSGGLSASGASGFILGPSASTVSMPITLGTAQTWHILGTYEGHFYGELPFNLTLDSGLSGPGALTTDLSGDVRGELQLAGDNEIGPVAIDGNGGADGDGDLRLPASGKLNASNGNAVTVNGGRLSATGAAVGPLTSTGGTVSVGATSAPAGSLTAPSARFDATSEVDFSVADIGSTPGTDYGQLTSTEAVDLGGAALSIDTFDGCAGVPVGSTYTLVSTTGSLSGRFTGTAANGTTVIAACQGATTEQPFRVDYNETGSPQTVTATALTPLVTTQTLLIQASTSSSPSSPLPVTNQPVTVIAELDAGVGVPSGTFSFAEGGNAIPGCSSLPVVASLDASYAASCRVSSISTAQTVAPVSAPQTVVGRR